VRLFLQTAKRRFLYTAIRHSVCRSHRRAAALGYRHAGCLQLSHVGLRTRPQTDVDPPRVELPLARAYRLAAPRGDNLFYVTWRTWCAEIPVFVRGLSSQTSVVGQTVQFDVVVDASPPASLAWLINGFALSGLRHCHSPLASVSITFTTFTTYLLT